MGIALFTCIPHTAMSFLPHSSELSDCKNNQEIHEDGIPTLCLHGADEKEPLPVAGVTRSLFLPCVSAPSTVDLDLLSGFHRNSAASPKAEPAKPCPCQMPQPGPALAKPHRPHQTADTQKTVTFVSPSRGWKKQGKARKITNS